MRGVGRFSRIRIGLASPDQIRAWSSGEVKKPETINYRTLKPEPEGLFCEKIFGPTTDWECHCGKYKRERYKGIVCDKCGVEVTRSKVRRQRLGHIELAAPVSHIWYFPGHLWALLGMSPRSLERVLYFSSHVVIEPGDTPLSKRQLLSDEEYREYRERYGGAFRAGMGAEAIKRLLEETDLDKLALKLQGEIACTQGPLRFGAVARLKVVESFRKSGNKPEWMILEVVPVIPPELRPMVQLDGGRFATSDLNDLYRRVINRNNRLKRLLELGAPEIIVRSGKRMLQEAVDALIDNGKRGRPVTGPGNRPLKSLSGMLKGKQGRFRQNLLGKCVDYSGRSVIVVGPELKLNQCGLPKEMALELFKPFVMKKLVDRGYAHDIKSAKRMVERVRNEVWDVLEEAIKDRPVLLNRAPTLHRLGIQAFEPVLVEGRAIRIHPLVCTGYDANFDGDQMAVHVPLSAEAQAEARLLMMSTNNILSPAHGRPIATPGQDLVLGCYYLTLEKHGAKGEGKYFASAEEAKMAYDEGVVDLHARVFVKMNRKRPWNGAVGSGSGSRSAPGDGPACPAAEDWMLAAGGGVANGEGRQLIATTVGWILFNEVLPDDLPYINNAVEDALEDGDYAGKVVSERGCDLKKTVASIPELRPAGKGFLAKLVAMCQRRYGNTRTAEILDNLKRLGYRFATRSGTTVAIGDIVVPAEKNAILTEAEREIERLENYYNEGSITPTEKYRCIINVWTDVTEKVQQAMLDALDKFNPVYMMATSGARGNVQQLRQLAGMRGLVADPSGRMIDLPIKANFREGLTVLEYFISTYGTRKGFAETALRTADSGYLARRLVDVAQGVIVREEDCGTDAYITAMAIYEDDELVEPLRGRIVGRVAGEPVVHPQTGEEIIGAGVMITEDMAMAVEAAGVEEVKIRSVLTCRTRYGVCAKCYGRNLATGRLVEVGEAAGIIAAQSIGEPGTQFTMRTFHTGGVAGDDITRGLPRVEELFEARKPKRQAIISEVDGLVRIQESKGMKRIVVVPEEGEERIYPMPENLKVEVEDGDAVRAGDRVTEGSPNPHEILKVRGLRGVQTYLVQEVQDVYRSQGVEINDKHVEVVVRQMLRKVRVDEPGDTDLLPGGLVDVFEFEDENARTIEQGGRPATARPVLLGITKASLATDSFLSAAAFQETTRVLTEASIRGRTDPLIGLKENVIIGKLIPAGTGTATYRHTDLLPEKDTATIEEELPSSEPQAGVLASEPDGPVAPEDESGPRPETRAPDRAYAGDLVPTPIEGTAVRPRLEQEASRGSHAFGL